MRRILIVIRYLFLTNAIKDKNIKKNTSSFLNQALIFLSSWSINQAFVKLTTYIKIYEYVSMKNKCWFAVNIKTINLSRWQIPKGAEGRFD